MENVTIFLAFVAGIVYFISPCVLPLVPAYIGYMGGRMTHTVAITTGGQKIKSGYNQRLSTVTHGLFFVAGFTFVFVAIGLLTTAFIQQVGGHNVNVVIDMIGRIGGIVIIFFGLQFMGIMPGLFSRFRNNDALINNPLISIIFALAGTILIVWGFTGTLSIWDITVWQDAAWPPILALIITGIFLSWLFLSGAFTSPKQFWLNTLNRIESTLYMDTRRQMNLGNGDRGYSSSALMGVVFSAGWTPCIGPVYGAVLTMAQNGGNIAQAGILLGAYSLGLGIPFLLTALLLDGAQSVLRGLQSHMHQIELVSGAFLIFIGVLVASGQLQSLSQQFSGQFADFSISVEESVLDFVTGSSSEAATTPEPDAQPADNETSSVDGIVITIPQDSTANDITALTNSTNSSTAPSVGIAVGNMAPQFETVNEFGQPVRLSDLRGQVVLLNFWATWCGPCRIEMPEFESVYNAQQADGFTILAVNSGETVADVQGFREEMAVTFPLAMDEKAAVQSMYNILSYPSTFIIGRDGTIIARHFGPLTAEQIQTLVTEALAA